jgi:hypothetical protein
MSLVPFVEESARHTPVKGEYDVVVAGAGPAGVAAALAAAREGAKTLLLENHGSLGGVWTSGALCWVIDSGNKKGLMQEIIGLLVERSAHRQKGKNFAFDIEAMKYVLEHLCLQAGVHVRLHHRVVGAIREGRRLKYIITESKSGRESFSAKVFIDATGDGDLAQQAGCQFDYGHPESGMAQPMSLVALVGGVNISDIAPFVGGGVKEAKKNLFEECRRAGFEPSYAAPTLFPIRDDFYGLVANHEYGVSPMNADELSEATIRARAELNGLIQALNSLGKPWADLKLIATGAQIGIREGRRIRGLYTVTLEDILTGKRHDDAVCSVTFGIDVHSINPKVGKSDSKENRLQHQPYDIPLRALIARDVDGLMMAGRCISGDFLAHSSYRVTGNAVSMGESAGICAAYCSASGDLPHTVKWDSLRDKIAAVVPTAEKSGQSS